VILISNHENAALGGFIKGYMFLQSSITPLNLNFLSQFFCSGAICFHIEINKYINNKIGIEKILKPYQNIID
jgi:hypothetical protein